MADRLRLTLPGRLWAALAALLGAGSLVGFAVPAVLLDWEPGLAGTEPWRLWTAAFVHWSLLHLYANLLGTAVVGAFGVAAMAPARLACAWALAWPLTQFGLRVQPALAHYGGLSGVLHAGVAVASLWLLTRARGRRRVIGAAVLAGLLTKVALEQPWGPPLRHGGGWDIATAPLAHATGVTAGLLCCALVLPWCARLTGSPPGA